MTNQKAISMLIAMTGSIKEIREDHEFTEAIKKAIEALETLQGVCDGSATLNPIEIFDSMDIDDERSIVEALYELQKGNISCRAMAQKIRGFVKENEKWEPGAKSAVEPIGSQGSGSVMKVDVKNWDRVIKRFWGWVDKRYGYK